METLIIHNVNLDKLEEQRKILWELMDKISKEDLTTLKEDEALLGVLNMLDEWSDGIYFANKLEADRAKVIRRGSGKTTIVYRQDIQLLDGMFSVNMVLLSDLKNKHPQCSIRQIPGARIRVETEDPSTLHPAVQDLNALIDERANVLMRRNRHE